MAPKKRKADEESEPAKSPAESTRMVTRASDAAARRQTRSSTQGGHGKSVKPVPRKLAVAARKKSKKKEEAESEQGEVAKSEEGDEAEAGEVNMKTVVIERCTQCNSFKTRADQVRASLEGLPGIRVTINPVKPRRGCFEIREEGGETFISLLDMKRPFKPLKDLNMQEVIDNIIQKIQ